MLLRHYGREHKHIEHSRHLNGTAGMGGTLPVRSILCAVLIVVLQAVESLNVPYVYPIGSNRHSVSHCHCCILLRDD